jgi:2-furoate---CoA ligase
MDLVTALRWAAERYPSRPAVRGTGRQLGYAAWEARTNQLARALVGAGVCPGDRVGVLLRGGEPLASVHLAAQKLGAATVPLSTRFGAAELRYCLADAGVRLLVVEDATAALAGTAVLGLPVGVRTAVDRAALTGEEPAEVAGPGPVRLVLDVLLRRLRAAFRRRTR